MTYDSTNEQLDVVIIDREAFGLLLAAAQGVLSVISQTQPAKAMELFVAISVGEQALLNCGPLLEL
jgi:dihydrodipicolinate synthase/N-acetylneuraminate lyase